METQCIEGHTHWPPLTHRATNWYGSVVAAIELNRHVASAADEGVTNAASLECFKKVVVRDPITYILKVKGKHA